MFFNLTRTINKQKSPIIEPILQDSIYLCPCLSGSRPATSNHHEPPPGQERPGATIQYQNDIEIAPIAYTKQQLEDSESTIATFASALINKNKAHGVEVNRRHAIALWTIDVQREYIMGDPKREELLGQVSALRYIGVKYSVLLTKLHRLKTLSFTSHGPRIPSLQHIKTDPKSSKKPRTA